MFHSIRRLFKRYQHINWVLADQILVSGTSFLSNILIARFLGVDDYGQFALLWILILFFTSIQTALLISPLMSLAPKYPDQEKGGYFGSVFIQQLIFGFFCVTISAAGMVIYLEILQSSTISFLLLPISFAIFFIQLQDFLRRIYFANGQPKKAFRNDAIAHMGKLALLFILFQTGRIDTAAILWVIAISAGLACLTTLDLLRTFDWTMSSFIEIVGRHWESSKWLTLSALMQWLSGNLFVITAGSLLGTAAVGAIKAGQNIMGVSHILFQGLENLVPIKASKILHENGALSLQRYLKKITIFGSVATLFIALFFSFKPEFWMTLFFGEEFSGYGFLLRGYALIYVCTFFIMPIRIFLRSHERTFPIFISYIVTTVVSILLSVPVISSFGLRGVIYGTLVITIVSILVLLYYSVYKYKLYRI